VQHKILQSVLRLQKRVSTGRRFGKPSESSACRQTWIARTRGWSLYLIETVESILNNGVDNSVYFRRQEAVRDY
jgi:hypothetical protein